MARGPATPSRARCRGTSIFQRDFAARVDALLPAHAILVIDGAGWHQTGGKLRVPDNITLLHLPPYSPELNPVENVWAYLHSNKLSNRVFDTYNAIVDACCNAWTWLTAQPDRITTLDTRSLTQVIA